MPHRHFDRWRVSPGAPVDLAGIDPSSTPGAPGGKRKSEDTFGQLAATLRDLQTRLWAEQGQALLVVLQAMDGGGKDGTIDHVFSGVNPQGCRITGFKVPSDEEKAHDFLWRVHKATPAKGEIAIFNRSHYEDVLIVRVHSFVPEHVWRGRYDIINEFEKGLAEAGTRIVKFFLHISKDEQAERFSARLADPAKRWKFRKGDLDERLLWDDYQSAYEDAIKKTSTAHAPWFVIPADHKWYRNWAVSHVLVDTLDDMNPRFPEPDEDLSGVTVV